MLMKQNSLRKIIFSVVMCVVVLAAGGSFSLMAQQPKVKDGAELKIALEKMLTLGSVLYVAAHPDDENTAALAYFSLGRKMRAGYLSLNRGGGGQNLIGSEKGPLMSALRTHELLAARRFDGTDQFFTRAVDFGYSKTPEETMAIWGKEKILEDMVYVIRKFRPDIMLTRFPTDGRGRHGHHTASAILAVEAFHAAGDAKRFPEQLKYVSPWQPKRIFWNNWIAYLKNPDPKLLDKLLKIDVGEYNRLLGKSYLEIAAQSRSMHKSQGFGAVARRGEFLDYYELLAGEPATKDVMEGIDTTWNRVPGSAKVRQLLEKANADYQAEEPQKILPVLMEAMHELRRLPEGYWKTRKLQELKEVIRSCAGLWIEAISAGDEVSPDQEMKVTAQLINRSGFPLTLKTILVPGENRRIPIDKTLEENKPFEHPFTMKVTETEYTHPFWLREKPGKGLYHSGNHRYKGMAAAPYPFMVTFTIDAGGEPIEFEAPVLYRWRDPVKGEKIRWLAVTPPVTVNFAENVFYFANGGSHKLDLILRSGPAPVSGTLKLNLPPQWRVEPSEVPFDIKEPLTEKTVSVNITPPSGNSEGDLTVDLSVEDKTYHRSRLTIDYDHLPLLTLHPKAETRLIRVDMKRTGKRIGYIMGSGDDIPKYLEQVGYRIDVLSDEDLMHLDLSVYDAVVTGVRAYNTRDILKHAQKRLLAYVKNGGRLVVQYNTHRGLKTEEIGPYPFKIEWKRVTEEDAKVMFLSPLHPLLNVPNKIQLSDFDGWVQERGLYFAGQWDDKYTSLLSCCDKKEEAIAGGLLYTTYGKGVFIYTGYAFFRQLPAGVSGAMKLFINLISQ